MRPEERLDFWKEIANYVGRSISTCLNWAKLYGLPIYRVDKKLKRSRVFAFKPEIDDWFKSRNRSGE